MLLLLGVTSLGFYAFNNQLKLSFALVNPIEKKLIEDSIGETELITGNPEPYLFKNHDYFTTEIIDTSDTLNKSSILPVDQPDSTVKNISTIDSSLFINKSDTIATDITSFDSSLFKSGAKSALVDTTVIDSSLLKSKSDSIIIDRTIIDSTVTDSEIIDSLLILSDADSTLIDTTLIDSSLFIIQSNKIATDTTAIDSSLFKSASKSSLVDTTVIDSSLLKSKADSIITDRTIIDSMLFLSGTDSTSIDTTLIDSSLFIYKSDSTLIDTTALDSVIVIDSLKIDSTARLEYFRFQRKDYPAVRFTEKKKSGFFAYPSTTNYSRSVKLDSTGQYVLITEKVGGFEPKVYLKMGLEEYIDLKIGEISRKTWEQLGYKYEIKKDTEDFSQFLTDITNIEIPLPSTSFLSIFGPPRISLRINGAVDIHGAWRNETTEGLTASRLGNTRNEPDFSQQVQISVNGTIGDKLSINADWNTERTFEYENQLKLKYTGYDDEIIQSIEAGNVALQTSPLVGGSEALFGVKAKFQIGPLTLTTLASQKKGEVQEVNLSGGSEKQKFEVHAYDYSENNYFIDEIYTDTSPNRNFFNRFYGEFVFQATQETEFYRIKDIEIWKSTTGLIDQGRERKVNAFIDLESRLADQEYGEELKDSNQTEINGESIIGGRFVKLTEGVDYLLQEFVGFVSFKIQIQKTDAIAVAYRIEGSSPNANDDLFYGEFTKNINDSTLVVLKMIKPENLQPSFEKAWKLQLKNIYPIGGRDIKEEGFTLDLQYRIEGQEPRNDLNGLKLLDLFGLDKTDASGTSTSPDGAFDFIPMRTIDAFNGEIIFPVLEPFGDNLPSELSDSLAYHAVYDTTRNFAKQDKTKDKFLIVGEYSASVSSVYNIGFNVVENSVRVTLNGQSLKEGIDYVVDYNVGQITIRNDAALVPGADLKITYEQNDLFALASKTLLGLRGLYEFSKNTRLGFSFLNLNQKTLSDKVRIGEEPIDNSIFGADFETKVDLPFVTKGLDNIISTRAPSSWDLKGEFAYMSPDPNTKKSTVASDNQLSIAYIDDFEGAKRIIPIGVSYTGWSDLSIPDSLSFLLDSLPDTTKLKYKGKSFWYNILPSDVEVKEIWPDKRVSRSDQQVTALDFVYRPAIEGTYNSKPRLDENLSQNWGGMMRGLSTTANNLVEENIEFIEFWMKIIDAPEGANLIVDIGQISEDVIPNKTFNTEDRNFNDNIDEGEDLGLDGLRDSEEPGYDPINNPDPNGDNFRIVQGSINPDDYFNINGTQGNALLTDIGRFPDSEDLGLPNFTLDRINSYYRYIIPIDTSRETNNFISGGGGTSQQWYQYRIPLKEFRNTIGNPSFSVVEHLRIWITGIEEEVHLRIAELNLVGNQWQKVLTSNVDESDSVLTISTINLEDNPHEYSIPPGVKRERDRSKPDEEVFKNEQSLQLIIKELDDGQKRETVKYLFRPLDVFNYRAMKFFIRGDENYLDPSSISYFESDTNYSADIYFKFGSDTSNFYEYRKPVTFDTRASTNGWSEIEIKFDEITAVKEKRDTTVGDFLDPVQGRDGHFYGVRGNPTLTRITFFIIGISNPQNKGTQNQSVSGNIWINELRVLGADDTEGWAYSASSSIKLADLLSVKFNTKRTDPYFHKLSERFGSRIDKQSWGISGDLDIIKLVPLDLEGSNLRLNYSHNESVSIPLYKPGTDVLVDEAAAASTNPDSVKNETHTLSISDTWSLSSIKIRIPSKAWYIEDIINSLSFGFNYNKTFSRNPTTLSTKKWIWNAKADYVLNLGVDNYFFPVKIPIIGDLLGIFSDYRNVKVYFTPQSFKTGLTAKRNHSFTQSRTKNTDPNIQRDFTTARNASIIWKITEGGFLNLSMNYSLDVSSSLAHVLVDENGIDRREKDIWRDIFGGELFGNDNNYKQTFDLRTKPKLPSLLDLNKYFTLDGGYSVTYNWKNNFQQGELGKSAGFSNRINASLKLRLKSIMDPVFGEEEEKSSTKSRGTQTPKRSGAKQKTIDVDKELKDQNERNIELNGEKTDSTVAVPDSLEGPSKFMQILGGVKSSFKWIFFDYEQISINFNQSNSKTGNGLAADGTGFTNFWGFKQDVTKGPTRAFMVGLSSDLGPRALGGTFQDNFSQNNSIDFKTSRPIAEGIKLDLSWKVDWGFNKATTFNTDSLTGEITVTNLTSTGKIDRSFLSLSLPFFETGIKRVNELYDPNATNSNENLSSAFIEGLETFPLLAKIPILSDFAKFIPRPNWKITWTGLEKIAFFEGLAKRISLNHGYTSSYTEGWKVNPDGYKEIQTQKISYGFSPLIGFDITFDDLLGGNLSGGIKFTTKTSYDLGAQTRNITETFSKDINLSASFSKKGFELPLFGVSLKNDIEISFSYTSTQNSVVIFEMGENFNEEGKPQDGTIRTTIEPRIRYVMSSRVTLSVFYRRTSVEPEGASRIPPTDTNEAGLDVHISIQ
ncbi:cell surface protein SprA [Bacteroidota bacterium]